MFLFLVTGIAYGLGARTIKSSTDVIKAMTKAVAGLGGTILLFLVISQFVAYFNYSNMPTLMAVKMADALKTREHRPALAAARLYRGRHGPELRLHAGDRQMGHLRAGLRAAVRDARRRSRGRPGGLSGRRFADQLASRR